MSERDALLEYAQSAFGAEAEHLWQRTPEDAILRRADNAKWFAVLMKVKRSALGLPGDGATEVVNVKCDPLLIGSLLHKNGVLPGYHMSKAHWITLLLDGSIPAEELCGLLRLSYDLAAPKSRRG